jgi:hypothetical protein
MQMMRHDLRLVLSRVLEMTRYRAPAFIHHAAHVVQFHQRIRSVAFDTPEQFLSVCGA